MRTEVFERLKQDFQDEEARYAYTDDFVNTYIAAQIKNLREERLLNQGQLAERIGTKQSGISRLENINYSSWKVETLRKIARALGLWLKISFEEFGEIPHGIDNFKKSLSRRAFADDPVFRKPSERSTPTENSMRDRNLIKATLGQSYLQFDAGTAGCTSLSSVLNPRRGTGDSEESHGRFDLNGTTSLTDAGVESSDPVLQPPPDKYRGLHITPPSQSSLTNPNFSPNKEEDIVWKNRKPRRQKSSQRIGPSNQSMQTTRRLRQVSGT